MNGKISRGSTPKRLIDQAKQINQLPLRQIVSKAENQDQYRQMVQYFRNKSTPEWGHDGVMSNTNEEREPLSFLYKVKIYLYKVENIVAIRCIGC